MQRVESVRKAVIIATFRVSRVSVKISVISVPLRSPLRPQKLPAADMHRADKRFGLHDSHVRFFRNRDEVVDDVTLDESAAAEMIRQTDLMDGAPMNDERTHP